MALLFQRLQVWDYCFDGLQQSTPLHEQKKPGLPVSLLGCAAVEELFSNWLLPKQS